MPSQSRQSSLSETRLSSSRNSSDPRARLSCQEPLPERPGVSLLPQPCWQTATAVSRRTLLQFGLFCPCFYFVYLGSYISPLYLLLVNEIEVFSRQLASYRFWILVKKYIQICAKIGLHVFSSYEGNV